MEHQPQNDDFWPQILPTLPTRASQNDINQSEYVIVMSNQTYLRITTHFGRHRRVFGKLLSDFWSTSPKNDDFRPQISPLLPSVRHNVMVKFIRCFLVSTCHRHHENTDCVELRSFEVKVLRIDAFSFFFFILAVPSPLITKLSL